MRAQLSFVNLYRIDDGAGLKRVRDKLLSDLRTLQKDKPRADDEARLSELSRLESALQVARDDLVSLFPFSLTHFGNM